MRYAGAMGRREEVLDGAISVLAQGGLRRLTHRAVDSVAALPAGSTSNVCRNREQLVSMTLRRVAERELALWSELIETRTVASADDLAATIALGIKVLIAEHRELILARRALTVDAGAIAAAGTALRDGRALIEAWAASELQALGSNHRGHDHLVLLAMIDGLISALLTNDQDRPDPYVALRTLLRGLLADTT